MVIFRSAVADWNDVPTGSMKPTIIEGDRILVNKLAYDVRLPLTHISLHTISHPQRGDIIVFDSKAAATRLVKRVIGIPGDVVAMRNNRLTVNGIPAQYDNVERHEDAINALESSDGHTRRIKLAPTGVSRLSSFGPVTVPQDHYLVLGDNRDDSADSRVRGFVLRAEIVGSAKRVVLSLDYDHYYIPRGDRFFRQL